MINVIFTLESGQIFLYKKNKNWHIVNGSDIIITSDDLKVFKSYNNMTPEYLFRLDDDIEFIKKSINKDNIINYAINKLEGLRIIRQDPFQCLISFICATNANIPRIKYMLNNILKFGNKIEWEGMIFRLFPEPKILANVSINELVNCGLGYRAKYVKEASYITNNGLDLEALKYIGYERAKEELMSIKGIGNKVADCILLFALEYLDAFPIDRWIFKILKQYYNINEERLTDKVYNNISVVMRNYFGRYAGYAQQYLYTARKLMLY